MTAQELRRLYIDFFVKKHGHKEIKGSSLIPENDPTVLFTTAGMHPLVPYLMGEKHPSGKRLVDVQKCVRTDDIDEVGDACHLTFFEMLGNWSLGDYFKEGAIEMSFEFLTKELKLPLEKLAVSCFKGDEDAPQDTESFEVWKKLGIKEERIAFLPKKNNWWGPAGKTGPCGPDTEMFYWTGEGKAPKKFDPDDNKWVEIWNDVFMQYNKKDDGTYEPLKQKNVDTGMGLERVLTIMNNVESSFDTELFGPVIEEIRLLSVLNHRTAVETRLERIIADHLRAATFIVGDEYGVGPSNKDQGYIVRRLIRRSIMHGRKLGLNVRFTKKIAEIYVNKYGDFYPILKQNRERIFEEMAKEEEKFGKTLHNGLGIIQREMVRLADRKSEGVKAFGENFVFDMFQSCGFPAEMTIELLKTEGWIKNFKEANDVIKKFNEDYEKHQQLSKSGAEKKFSGGLAGHGEEEIKLHTATHLLNAALRLVLGPHVEQRGSNITPERLRFDFPNPEKLTPEQLKKVEEIVNEQIKKSLPITMNEMTVDEAKAKGAIGVFGSKYGDRVKVYKIGDFSTEICGGPHVKNTSELKSFKILKEEASSSGIRRIKAVVGK